MTLSVVRLTVDYVHISSKKYTNVVLNFRQGEEADLPAERHFSTSRTGKQKSELMFE